MELARQAGTAQHLASLARGSRGAGANLWYRIMGAEGEVAVAMIMGIPPQVRALDGPDRMADIVLRDPPLCVEVKVGWPMVWIDGIKPRCHYVALERVSPKLVGHEGCYVVTAVGHGRTILAAREFPPEEWCPRPGTREQNYVIR